MSQSQMLLILGAVLMFSFITLTAHRTVMTASTRQLESEYVITAAEIAETLTNEIKSKAFDEAVTNGATVTDVNAFTVYLGPGVNEYPGGYDDVDDYITDNSKNMPLVFTTPRAGNFTATVSVNYVKPQQPTTVSYTPTRTKRIRISVSAARLPQALVLTSFVSY
ncbi:MAG TPA: hypothetical protein PLG50_11570 [bacterium]|nr:hypothetical protein [bacterium]HQG46287.1 hypothetical protein [bacterium]HQI49489.1 hypothetical protein [bacterium]HQJ64841.1 hypothetical protein [bacterium]